MRLGARIERGIEASVEASARLARREVQLMIASIGRVLLGVFFPVPTMLFIWRALASGGWLLASVVAAAAGILGLSILAAATVSSGALARRVFETKPEAQEFTMREAVSAYLPFAALGLVAQPHCCSAGEVPKARR